MRDNILVRFEKHKDYRSFHVTRSIASYNRDMITVHLFDETMPLISEILLDEETGETKSILEDGNVVSTVHASMTVSPANIPYLIDSLQSVYDSYIDQLSGGEDE